jgi:hypothetical protein
MKRHHETDEDISFNDILHLQNGRNLIFIIVIVELFDTKKYEQSHYVTGD